MKMAARRKVMWKTTTNINSMDINNNDDYDDFSDNFCPLVGDNFCPPCKVTPGVEEDANFANCFPPLLLQPNPSHDDFDDHDDYSYNPTSPDDYDDFNVDAYVVS